MWIYTPRWGWISKYSRKFLQQIKCLNEHVICLVCYAWEYVRQKTLFLYPPPKNFLCFHKKQYKELVNSLLLICV